MYVHTRKWINSKYKYPTHNAFNVQFVVFWISRETPNKPSKNLIEVKFRWFLTFLRKSLKKRWASLLPTNFQILIYLCTLNSTNFQNDEAEKWRVSNEDTSAREPRVLYPVLRLPPRFFLLLSSRPTKLRTSFVSRPPVKKPPSASPRCFCPVHGNATTIFQLARRGSSRNPIDSAGSND